MKVISVKTVVQKRTTGTEARGIGETAWATVERRDAARSTGEMAAPKRATHAAAETTSMPATESGMTTAAEPCMAATTTAVTTATMLRP